MQNNTEKNITRYNIWLLVIVLAAKWVRWNIMLFQLVYMSIGWGMSTMIASGMHLQGGHFQGVTTNALWFFSHINFLHIKTFIGWEWFFTIVYNLIFYFIIVNFYKKNPYVGWKENLFIYLNIAVLNIFCFTMSKECYQVLFWMLAAFMMQAVSGYRKKVIALMVALVITFVYCRKYYALIGIYYFVTQFYVTTVFTHVDTSTKAGRRKLAGNVLSLIVTYGVFHFIFMSFMAGAFNEQYDEMVRVNTREGSMADSEIAPIFKGNQLMFTLDYFVKIFRLTFPIELLIKPKPTYIITIAYQALLAYFLMRAFNSRHKESIEDLIEQEEADELEAEEQAIMAEMGLATATASADGSATGHPVAATAAAIADDDERRPSLAALGIATDDDDDEAEAEEAEAADEDDDDEDINSIPELRDRLDERTIALYTYIAFLLCSAMFEPDFGSWLRHQSVAFPIILLIL